MIPSLNQLLIVLAFSILLNFVFLYFFWASCRKDIKERRAKNDFLNHIPLYEPGDYLVDTPQDLDHLINPFEKPSIKILRKKQNQEGVWFYEYEVLDPEKYIDSHNCRSIDNCHSKVSNYNIENL